MVNDSAADATTAPTSAATAALAIDIIGMNKWYGDFHVLKDINLDGRCAASAS